uniref:X8 domain-containing protein n=1 Tax=Oryza meridionalis TaxID=40149 RepID=A0A0E0EEU8_9ORYZ
MLAKRLKRCSILLLVFLLSNASGSLLESSGGQAEAIGPQISPATEGEGKRRSLATGMFCVALPNADPTALQEGLNWACGQGHANCAAIQPGGPCYKANNLPALASYAYNDYYQRNSGAGATCSFNGTATTTANDPKNFVNRARNLGSNSFMVSGSGQCVFSGSSMAGGTTPAANAPSAVGPFTPGFGNGSSPTFPGTGSPGGALTPFDAADSVMSGARRALCALLLASPIFLSLLL